jgi:PKD repeat protein
MKYVFTFFILIVYTSSYSQKYDYNWLAGDNTISNWPTTNFILNFNIYPVQISPVATDYFLSLTHHSMSDIEGNFLYYSNGCNIWQYNEPPILISDNLNNDDFACSSPSEAMTYQHALFSLPIGEGRYMVLGFTVIPQTNCYIQKFYYHILNFSSGIGQMESQDVVIAEGCFNGSAANRHANGRDWWILLADRNEHRYYRWLLTPEGLSQPDTQTITQAPFPGKVYGWYEFSPDGQKMAIHHSDKGAALYNFDRCTGLLTDYQLLPQTPGYGGIIAFSPNNRYLYSDDNSLKTLIQYDLTSPDIENSKHVVSTYDGFIDSLTLYPVTFGAATRGPDGKIYSFGSVSHYMHIIDFPDRPGSECHVRQRAITFPSSMLSANAYYPNYRLGPIDGSSCDSLGIDNIPMAMYHYDIEDTLVPLSVTFTDASYYEPTNWYWTFGDGSSSTEVSPVHTYAGPGTYTACLVVSNQYGADTLCRDILVDDISGVSNLPALPQVQVGPNPFNDVLQVQLPAIVSGVQPQFRLLDLFGREVFRTTLRDFDNVLSVKELPAGMYVWQVAWQGKVTQAGKAAKF